MPKRNYVCYVTGSRDSHPEGKRWRKYFTSIEAAQHCKARIEGLIRDKPELPTLGRVIKEAIVAKKEAGLVGASLHSFEKELSVLITHFDTEGPLPTNPVQLQRLLELSSSSINVFNGLRVTWAYMFRRAVERGYIDPNPIDCILAKARDQRVAVPPTPDEVSGFMAEAFYTHRELVAAFAFSFFAGHSIRVVAELRWDDVDVPSAAARLRRRGKIRKSPLSPNLCEWLRVVRHPIGKVLGCSPTMLSRIRQEICARIAMAPISDPEMVKSFIAYRRAVAGDAAAAHEAGLTSLEPLEFIAKPSLEQASLFWAIKPDARPTPFLTEGTSQHEKDRSDAGPWEESRATASAGCGCRTDDWRDAKRGVPRAGDSGVPPS